MAESQGAGLVFQERQHPAAHAAAPPFRQHGHSSHVRPVAVNVGQQPAGGDDRALMQGYGVNGVRGRVRLVHLNVGGDALFADENAHPHGDGALQLGRR